MIYLNIESDPNVSAKRSDYLTNDNKNKDLWRNALEKNGLYQSLKEFKSIHFSSNDISQNNQYFEGKKQEKQNDSLDEQLDTKLVEQGFQASSRPSGTVDSMPIIKNVMSKIDQTNYSGIAPNLLSSNYRTLVKNTHQNMFSSITLTNMKWLNKNALVTLNNSNMEIWIRDASLTEYETVNLLKDLKQTMANLGASLVKVAINGKVVFRKNS